MKKRFLLLCPVLFLSACGFEPLYGTTRFAQPSAAQASTEAQLATIAINNIPDREGQILRNLLIDRFYQQGRVQNPAYTLEIEKLKQTNTDLDITKESDATRAQLRVETTMRLVDAGGQILLTRRVSSVGSYNILTSEFATRVSEDNTRKNLLEDLAARIELQISLYFQGLGRE